MTVLKSILSSKLKEVQRLKMEVDLSTWREKALAGQPCRDLVAALRACRHAPVIAEIKRMSPSEGMLRDVESAEQLARCYEAAGAVALSVLTDGPFFHGSLEDLKQARAAVNIPILRKDFILDPVQVYESKLAGADAVLLIAAALEPSQLKALYMTALSLGMTPLVEVHDESELPVVLELQPRLVGINNRNLGTLEVSLDNCVKLRPLIPPGVLVLGESGIRGPADVSRLRQAGIDAFLVGTTLMRSPDVGQALTELCRAGA